MKTLPIRARLAVVSLAVLAVATLALAGGAWWLLRNSIIRAADASLATRVESTTRFIREIRRALPPENLSDEFGEFAELTKGESLLEVVDDQGRTLCVPAMAGWDQLRVPVSANGAPAVVPRVVGGQPFRAVAADLVIDDHGYRLYAAVPMAIEYAALQRFGRLLLLLVPVVLAVAAAGGFWIAGRALAPVDRMMRDVQSISLRHLDRRLNVPAADDELRRLAVTFNEMLARLQQSVADMARFTAEAAHELRTPVSLARTSAEVTLARDRGASEYRQALTDVLGQTERMSTLVDDLLALARSDAGVEPTPLTLVDLRDTARDVAHDAGPLAARRALRLNVVVPDQPAMVRGSDESLRRLLLILLDNAARYTPAGGHVEVNVSTSPNGLPSGPSVVVEVVDSGPGIDPVDAGRIFDRFYRGMSARQQAPDGSGLGLSIARAIVERHSGAIDVGAGPDGYGCRARVRLPLVIA